MSEAPSPQPVVSLRDLEAMAEAVMEPGAFAYYASGAGDEDTLRDNEAAFARRRLRPRVLTGGAAQIDLGTTLLGSPVSLPVGLAPTARHALAHSDAEVATASAAAAAGVMFCAATLSSRPMEEIAAASDGPQWFQLYTHADRAVSADLLDRAAASGYSAVVLTVDLPVVGRRDREVRGGYLWPQAEAFGNFAAYPQRDRVSEGLHRTMDTWDDLSWIRDRTGLPLVLKGVLTGEDAALAVRHGASAVWVSNHGGRQLDRVPAALDVLEEIVDAVDGEAEVYLDGGVRRGTDVLMALGLGARAAFLGRPYLYALATGGAAGVTGMLQLVREELEVAMALLGTASVADVGRSHLTD